MILYSQCSDTFCLQCNGKHVNDNRMRFLFGTSEKGSYDAAMDALQKEVDELGLTEGLSRQEVMVEYNIAILFQSCNILGVTCSRLALLDICHV